MVCYSRHACSWSGLGVGVEGGWPCKADSIVSEIRCVRRWRWVTMEEASERKECLSLFPQVEQHKCARKGRRSAWGGLVRRRSEARRSSSHHHMFGMVWGHVVMVAFEPGWTPCQLWGCSASVVRRGKQLGNPSLWWCWNTTVGDKTSCVLWWSVRAATLGPINIGLRIPLFGNIRPVLVGLRLRTTLLDALLNIDYSPVNLRSTWREPICDKQTPSSLRSAEFNSNFVARDLRGLFRLRRNPGPHEITNSVS